MTIDRMVADAEELVSCLRKTYGRKRIVLMGHSWGTVLGVKLAQLHTDWFSAYVGMSQFVDFERSEGMGYQATLFCRARGSQQTSGRRIGGHRAISGSSSSAAHRQCGS
jgi:pimeloyl-ACP methyl ester carboxylesterase